ncbi:hypothetical protein Lalb_Chr24g0399311 [Lupinus albus]|uniref:Uncharacterized protein n=1 Tax=Lupinus albus TaxID=3870 RepID=A0A6A4NHW3_LUPAL|nr:hypothetical protein Lalb_Chr24g0399311 [Lupinus albus]
MTRVEFFVTSIAQTMCSSMRDTLRGFRPIEWRGRKRLSGGFESSPVGIYYLSFH